MYIRNLGHMTKMVAMSIYGRKAQIFSSTVTVFVDSQVSDRFLGLLVEFTLVQLHSKFFILIFKTRTRIAMCISSV